MENNKHITISFLSLVMLCGLVLFNGAALAASKKPNILVIWGDDIGHDNISVYHRGMLGEAHQISIASPKKAP